MTRADLIEALADAEHASWARWQAYLHSRCTPGPDGGLVILQDLVEQWKRRSAAAYADLSEEEKQAERGEVSHILPTIDEYVTARRPG